MKKRIVRLFSIIISIAMAISCYSIHVYSEQDPGESTVVRDTVLVLDVSGSMSGTPISEMREAAKLFCESVLNASGTNRVAIVSFESYTYYTTFTSDYSTLESYINNFYASGGTNMNGGMLQAKDLLENYSSEGAIKNIVIMADGLPQSGIQTANGRYSSSDINSYYYMYANTVYNTTVAMHSTCNVYSLGFFHSLYGEELAFGQKFMNDLQNAGYYDVTDAESLEFTFGEIADDITNDSSPIIIIPGIMGSNLYFSNSEYTYATKAWPPGGNVFETAYGLVGLGEIMKDWTLYTRPYENQNDAAVTREYGAQDVYKALVDGLCEQYGNGDRSASNYREIYFFSYDFRQSNVITAEKLEAFIESEGFSSVDIVAHSMGGLVASNYMLSEENRAKVGKVITCGTPYEGAPKLLNCVLNWDVLTNRYEQSGWSGFTSMMSDNVLGMAGLTKEVKASFTSTAELCPTKNYFNGAYKWYRYAYTERAGFLNLQRTDHYEEIDYAEYTSICTDIFGSKFRNAVNVQEALNVDGYNILTTLDNTYFVVGVNQQTIGAILFNDGDSLKTMECDDLEYEYLGDGTVPYYSATVMNRLIYLPDKQSRVLKVATDHGGTCSDSKALAWIYDILNEGSSDLEGDTEESRAFIVIRIACPVDVEISRAGETLNSDFSELSVSSSFGRLDILGGSDEVKMLCLDDLDDLELKLTGTDDGTMDYEIRWFNEEGIMVDSKSFTDVPIESGLKIYTSTDEDNITLDIDTDGDGYVDGSISPDDENDSIWAKLINFFKSIIEWIKSLFSFSLI